MEGNLSSPNASKLQKASSEQPNPDGSKRLPYEIKEPGETNQK